MKNDFSPNNSIYLRRRSRIVLPESAGANNCRDGRGDLRDTVIFALTPEDYMQSKAEWEQAQSTGSTTAGVPS